MSARAQIPVGQLSLPVPGLTLGGDGLTIGFERGGLFASGQVTLQYGTVARGELRVDASTRGGLTASGQIDLTIPGLDTARGRVAMDNRGRVSGSNLYTGHVCKVAMYSTLLSASRRRAHIAAGRARPMRQALRTRAA